MTRPIEVRINPFGSNTLSAMMWAAGYEGRAIDITDLHLTSELHAIYSKGVAARQAENEKYQIVRQAELDLMERIEAFKNKRYDRSDCVDARAAISEVIEAVHSGEI